MLHGFATPEGTRLYAEQFPIAASNEFFRIVNDLSISSIGLGTYLGEPDEATDQAYENATLTALRNGINFIDTSINYREQRSEKSVGDALRRMLNSNEIQRDQFVVCTKAGFLTQGAIPDWLTDDDIVGGVHSLHPDFLEDQLDRSRANLEIDTIDVFYLHNAELQLRYVARPLVEQRIQLAFERMERLVRDRRIRWYGTATWEGYREPGQFELDRIIDLAKYVAGDDHHFRFIQLPFNLGMIEAYQNRDRRGVSPLKVAERAGITAVASATLYESRLARNLPDIITSRIPGLEHDASRAIQFTRSTPGISVALVGMSNPEHVRENLEVAGVLPMGTPDYEKLYRPLDA